MPVQKWTWIDWFCFIYALALLTRGIWWVIHLPPLGMILVLSLLALLCSGVIWVVWCFKTHERRAEAQEKRLGYRILQLTPNELRMGIEEWAVEYRENGQSFLLYGDKDKGKLRHLNIPSEATWDSIVPDWVKGRRQEILARVIEEMAYDKYIRREI